MGTLNQHRDLARLLECRRKEGQEHLFWESFDEALEQKHLVPQEFSIQALWECFVPDGREAMMSWSTNSGGPRSGVQLTEAGDAVKTSDFSDITGQILFTKMMESYQDPAFLHDKLTTTVPTQFNGEKIPGIARIGDVAESIGENEPYPIAGVTQDYVETPETTKRGFIVPVTKEAIFFDRTGDLMRKASEGGVWLGVNKEKRVLDVVLGLTDTYNRKSKGTVANYGDNSGNHDWDNLAASNALVDWTDVETALLLFDGLTDPNTGEPIMVTPTTLIVPTALLFTAKRIINATQLQHVDNQAAANTVRTAWANPVNNYAIASNQYVKSRTSSATTWFIGDFKKGFEYRENWPITPVTAPPNAHEEFHRDIVHQTKVSERGVAVAVDPRMAVKCTA